MPAAVNAPIFDNDSVVRIEVACAGVCATAAYLTPTYVRPPSGLLHSTSDPLRISRMDDLVVVAMEDDCRHRFCNKLQRLAPNFVDWRFALPHGGEGRQEILCCPESETRMNSDSRV